MYKAWDFSFQKDNPTKANNMMHTHYVVVSKMIFNMISKLFTCSVFTLLFRNVSFGIQHYAMYNMRQVSQKIWFVSWESIKVVNSNLWERTHHEQKLHR